MQSSPRERLGRFFNSDRGLCVLYLPAMALIILFVFYPLLLGAQISLTNWNGYSQKSTFVGLRNYIQLFQSTMLTKAVGNTLIYGFGSTVIQTLLGLLYAVLLNKSFFGRTAARVVIYIPVMVAQIITGYIWYFMIQFDRGALNDILKLLHLQPVDWLADGLRAVWIVTLINGVNYVGKTMIIFLAGLQGISASLYEAAAIDGASGFRQFKSITVPQLMPAFTTNILLNLIGGLKLFGLIVSMTGGGPGFASHSLQTLISYYYFENQSAGYSAAIGMVTFVFIATLSLIVKAVINKKEVDLT